MHPSPTNVGISNVSSYAPGLRTAGAARAPSPRLRGEGRGEGESQQRRARREPPHPTPLRGVDLSPQAGRGGASGSFPASTNKLPVPPDLVGHLDDHGELRPLLVLGERVAFLGRGEA